MGYKRIGEEIGFADLAIRKSLEHNRSIKLMDKINGVVRWKNVEALLMEYYDPARWNRIYKFAWGVNDTTNIIQALCLKYIIPLGKSKTIEGADVYPVECEAYSSGAYPPLLLLKCLLLQKWFRIPSDPELENQINDRISFKKFLGLPLDKPSPDHSTFSRFRNRLSKEAMILLNNIVLQEFARRGLSINEGIAVDARLVESASKPLSNDEIKKEREKRGSPEGKLDRNGNLLKFSRDLESDWSAPGGIRNALCLCA
jgi:transposase